MNSGEVTSDSPLGRKLTELALISNTMVEIGTWNGLGSTLCLLNGVKREGQYVYSFESNKSNYDKSVSNLCDHPERIRLSLVHGCVSNLVKPLFHPVMNIQVKEEWDEQMRTLSYCDPIPFGMRMIDLLFLDGGDFSSDGDFLTLWNKSNVIVLDDTNKLKSVKNHYARDCLIQSGWIILADELNDRHGWFAAKRP